MSHESELKFTFSSSDDNRLRDLLNHFGTNQGSRLLVNRYYDNVQMDLQRHRIGCRTREWQDGEEMKAEQTVKLAGVVKNGLHQRPEYNLDINSGEVPNLTRFPSGIWPPELDIIELNKQLGCIFEVRFLRTAWSIHWPPTEPGGEIEVALDEGAIEASGARDAIYELELELKKGELSQLESFANAIMRELELFPYDKSKAQRGYELLAAEA